MKRAANVEMRVAIKCSTEMSSSRRTGVAPRHCASIDVEFCEPWSSHEVSGSSRPRVAPLVPLEVFPRHVRIMGVAHQSSPLFLRRYRGHYR